MDPSPPKTAAAKPFTVIATSELYVMGLLGASSEPPSAQSTPAPTNATTASERMLSPTSSAARRESEQATSACPTIVQRRKSVSATAQSSATPAMRTYCGWTRTPPTFQARSEMPAIAAGNVPELEQEQRLCEERGSERDDRAREARRPATEANGDDRENRRQKRGDEDRDQTRQCERHVVRELEGEEAPDHDEHALREVHDPGRPVDEHEAHPDERERGSGREADDDELQELVIRARLRDMRCAPPGVRESACSDPRGRPAPSPGHTRARTGRTRGVRSAPPAGWRRAPRR